MADPPWRYRVWTGGKIRTADSQYPTMSLDELCSLKSTVSRLTLPDCALFLWATPPTLPDALTLIDAWGFQYKTFAFVWHKLTRTGKSHVGLGTYSRANAEPCLLAIRGKPERIESRTVVRQEIVYDTIREHSRKPEFQYEKIEALFKGPYCEMFARQTRKGWTAWGNETNKFSSRD